MKYVDTEALARLFGKVLPFSVDYFAKHIEKTLISMNDGLSQPELGFAGVPDILLANNRSNKTGMWDLCTDFDFGFVTQYKPVNNYSDKERASLNANIHPGINARKNILKEDWRVLYHLKLEDQFDGTPWLIIFPLQFVMKHYPHKTKGTYFGYSHGIVLMDEKDKNNDEYAYVGITKRSWLTRMAEHVREINSGSNKTFHRAWRNHIGRRNVMLTSQLVVANHTFDEIMQWEEEQVDKEMAAGTSLNMIPGGFKGMRFLHEHRLTKSPVVSLKERDRAEQEYQKQHPREGIPNLLISELWKDDEWAEKVICGPENRLSPEQVRTIRALDEDGLSHEEIVKQVGAKNILQVKRVLNGDTYPRIH